MYLCLRVFIITHVEVPINSMSNPPLCPRGDSVTCVLSLYHGGIDAVELMYCSLYLDARAFTGKRRWFPMHVQCTGPLYCTAVPLAQLHTVPGHYCKFATGAGWTVCVDKGAYS